MPMNYSQIRADLKALIEQIRANKAIHREFGQPNLTMKVRWDLIALKEEATRLCCLRAHLRGKIHLSNKYRTRKGMQDPMTRDEQLGYVTNLLHQYELPATVAEQAVAA